jgi:hypothetical protein
MPVWGRNGPGPEGPLLQRRGAAAAPPLCAAARAPAAAGPSASPVAGRGAGRGGGSRLGAGSARAGPGGPLPRPRGSLCAAAGVCAARLTPATGFLKASDVLLLFICSPWPSCVIQGAYCLQEI